MSGTDYLTELDPENDGEPPLAPVQTSLPEGIAASRDTNTPQLRDDRNAAPDAPFNIIETDDNLVPLSGRQPTEPRLDEIDAGPRSLVERQAAQDAADDAAGRPRQPRTGAERRAARREGRERTLQENQDLRREITELRQWRESVEPRLAQFEPRLNEIDQGRVTDQLAAFDRGIQEQQARATAARRLISEAMISQDGEALNAALEQRDDAVMQTQRLQVQRNMLATGDPLGRADPRRQGVDPNAPQERQPARQMQPPPPPLSPQAQAMANEFAARHDWIRTVRTPEGRARGRDVDSDIALRLDQQVFDEGYRAENLDYWDRLDVLMEQYLPHRVGEPQPAPPARRNADGNGNGQRRQTQPAPERRGPMVQGGAGAAPARSSNDVYLSPMRKQAMMEAGIIGRDGRTVENKTRFQRVLKEYQEFDRANGTVRQ